MKNLPQRKSIRLKNYDYSANGFYFITICTQNKECLFGEIINGNMGLNRAGKIMKNIWKSLPDHHSVKLDAFQIMPNHVHFVIQMNGERVTTRVVRTIGDFDKCLWQRNYYEHIIRTENDLNRIRQYIKINPTMWNRDTNNPKNCKINL